MSKSTRGGSKRNSQLKSTKHTNRFNRFDRFKSARFITVITAETADYRDQAPGHLAVVHARLELHEGVDLEAVAARVR